MLNMRARQWRPILLRRRRHAHAPFPGRRNDLDPGALRAPERWTLHDLRRTLATGLQKLGVRLEVTEAVLNHVSGSRAGIAGVYQRHSWADEKRAALDAWGAHVAALVEGREPQENVLPLSARAGAKTAN